MSLVYVWRCHQQDVILPFAQHWSGLLATALCFSVQNTQTYWKRSLKCWRHRSVESHRERLRALGLSSLGKGRFREDHVSVYKYLMQRSKDFRARHFTVVSNQLIRIY